VTSSGGQVIGDCVNAKSGVKALLVSVALLRCWTSKRRTSSGDGIDETKGARVMIEVNERCGGSLVQIVPSWRTITIQFLVTKSRRLAAIIKILSHEINKPRYHLHATRARETRWNRPILRS
jgi:hypothetical protein